MVEWNGMKKEIVIGPSFVQTRQSDSAHARGDYCCRHSHVGPPPFQSPPDDWRVFYCPRIAEAGVGVVGLAADVRAGAFDSGDIPGPSFSSADYQQPLDLGFLQSRVRLALSTVSTQHGTIRQCGVDL